MSDSNHINDAYVHVDSGTVSINATKTVGLKDCNFTDNNTRYVTVSPTLLREWADAVEKFLDDTPEVHVAVTPGKPLIAKRRRSDSLGICLAPRAFPEDDD